MRVTYNSIRRNEIAGILSQHVSEVVHGTSSMEAEVIASAQSHLTEDNRNPHGLTVDDLEVYTREQVDTLLAERSTLLDGGTIP